MMSKRSSAQAGYSCGLCLFTLVPLYSFFSGCVFPEGDNRQDDFGALRKISLRHTPLCHSYNDKFPVVLTNFCDSFAFDKDVRDIPTCCGDSPHGITVDVIQG